MSSNMFRFMYLVVITATVFAADMEEVKEKCITPIMKSKVCCKSLPPPPTDLQSFLKECMQVPDGPFSCEREICFSTKKGVGTPDGKIIWDKMTEEMENVFADAPVVLGAIKKQCMDGDISKFGPPDVCELKKWRICLETQILKTCTDWSDDGECDGIKEKAEECVKIFE